MHKISRNRSKPDLGLRRRRRRQRGAALVEFALVAPLLLTLIFAVVEFGWTFSQVLDMRHGARETARLAAVNYQPSTSTGDAQTVELLTEACLRVEDPTVTTVTLTFDVSSDTEVGDYATVRVERSLETLTGFFDSMLGSVTPNSEVSFRLEQDATWNETLSGAAQACP